MNKAEMLKKQAEFNTDFLYPTNESINIESVSKETNSEIIQAIKENSIQEKNKDEVKMLSFRIPQYLIDNIDKYAYVERMKKQDLIIMCFETFFNSDKAINVLKQYDKIMKDK